MTMQYVKLTINSLLITIVLLFRSKCILPSENIGIFKIGNKRDLYKYEAA